MRRASALLAVGSPHVCGRNRAKTLSTSNCAAGLPTCAEEPPRVRRNPQFLRLVQPPPAPFHHRESATKRMGGQLLPSHGRINQVSAHWGNSIVLEVRASGWGCPLEWWTFGVEPGGVQLPGVSSAVAMASRPGWSSSASRWGRVLRAASAGAPLTRHRGGKTRGGSSRCQWRWQWHSRCPHPPLARPMPRRP